MQATLTHAIGGLHRRDFHRYLHDLPGQRGRFRRETNELMESINVPLGENSYDAEVYCPMAINMWNDKYNGSHKFKLFIFGSNGLYKPLFKYGPDEYDRPLILYFDQGHFHGVQKGGNLFGMPYCFSCEKTYQSASVHNKDCKARCSKW